MGDVFFDLANFSINHGLDREARADAPRRLLRERSVPSDERALELMLFMSDFREAMWGVVQGAVSEFDFDFAGYAAEHFERLEATAASPAFVSALEAEYDASISACRIGCDLHLHRGRRLALTANARTLQPMRLPPRRRSPWPRA